MKQKPAPTEEQHTQQRGAPEPAPDPVSVPSKRFSIHLTPWNVRTVKRPLVAQEERKQ